MRAYRWALAPVQSDPQRAEYHLSQAQTDATNTGEIFGGAFQKFVKDEALVDFISSASLTSMLQQYIWSRDDSGDHLNINALWDLLTSNVYLHRLRNRAVLQQCLEQGVEEGAFGYAASHDGSAYAGLRFGEAMADGGSPLAELRPGFLVRPEAAARQKQEERATTPTRVLGTPGYSVGPGLEIPKVPLLPDTPEPTPAGRRTRRIVTRKTTGPNISLDDINLLREEIIRNLSDDGGEITVEITVSASKPEGFSEGITRSVRDNSAQLGLEFSISEEE